MHASPLSPVSAGGPTERALVLGGGGAAGNAWTIGVVAGLAAAGVDLTAADLVVGTSAGATAAAQLTGGSSLDGLCRAALEASPAAPSPSGAAGPRPNAADAMARSQAVIDAAADPADMRRRMGAAALERDTPDDRWTARWHDVVAARLAGLTWPAARMLVTAVHARTGEPAVFEASSGVDLLDAVAASTSNGFGGTYRIGSERYIDGGYRRGENADLAHGCARVLVLSPFSGRTRMPAGWRMDLASQVAELRADGALVETVFPGAEAGDVFNASAVDPATRPQAARAGYEQGRALAGRIATLWG